MKNTLWISLVVVGLLVAVFFVGKRQKWFGGIDPELEEKESTTDPEPNGESTLPTNTTGKPKKPGGDIPLDPSKPKPPTSFSTKAEVTKLANLFTSIGDWNGQDDQAFSLLLKYSANEVRAIANTWKNTYTRPQGGIYITLRQQVQKEVVWSSRPDVIKKKELVIKRLDDLKIP
ncbi:hypothetical protein [Haliscomenobacter hydrossis]|uniref:Uncharacterized protein n=1 Tax=Haliscomenobacter hydrossis (strain ATCC 27775 / DSM 1100 / LMG 10767 / O) TaxID=760192 RepID=F4KZ69_HALH1|nr:hypothetical protein [Haliscomenobacter hydrossis]AEE53723.1 hypothetical protein Halhy_5900 [Haliscomenobacter hydrossis DSM 1100]